MELVDKFEPEIIALDLAKDQHIFGGKLKEKDINTRRRKLQFTYDGKPIELAGTTVTAYVVTPINDVQSVPCTIDGDYAILDLPTSTRSSEGEINVEVELVLNDNEASTFSLDFEVVKSLRDDRAIQSTNEFTALQELIAAIGGIGDVPKDLELTKPSNNLHLIDATGNKVGNGIVLDGIGSGDCDVPKLCVVCGERQDGDTSDAQRIQRAIDSSQVGDIIKFPNGLLTIDKPIILKPNRTYVGGSWGSCITAADNANLAEMVSLPQAAGNDRVIIKGIRLDGNKGNSGANTGIYLSSMVNGYVQDVYVMYCKGTGIYLDGITSSRSSTVHFFNCRVLGCGGYGVYISEWCEDIHIYKGDIGLNTLDGIHLKAPSSSIRDVTCWANQKNGVYLDYNATSGQLWNSQIEGNAEIGVFVNASFFYICGNKIYDNANIASNYGKFDGIYVNACDAFKDAPLEGVSIIGNKVYSGLYQNTGFHRYALGIDKFHKNFTIYGNDFLYQGNATLTAAGGRVYGVNDTDRTDYNWINTFAKINMSANQAAVAYADTKIEFDTVLVDVDGNYKDGKLTIKDSGYYKLNCNIHVDNASVTSYNTLSFYVNNACKARVAGVHGGASNFITLSGCDTYYLEAGDVVEVYFRSTENVSINNATYLSSLTLSKA